MCVSKRLKNLKVIFLFRKMCSLLNNKSRHSRSPANEFKWHLWFPVTIILSWILLIGWLQFKFVQTFIYTYNFTNVVYKLFTNCFDNQAKAVNSSRKTILENKQSTVRPNTRKSCSRWVKTRGQKRKCRNESDETGKNL